MADGGAGRFNYEESWSLQLVSGNEISAISVKILFLSRWYPDPPDNGSKLRIFHLLNGLRKRHDVDLISFTRADRQESNDQSISRKRGTESVCGTV